MLATLNLVRKYNHKYTLKKYTFLYQNLLNFEGASMFCKGLAVAKIATTQSNSIRAVLNFFYLQFYLQFLKTKILPSKRLQVLQTSGLF